MKNVQEVTACGVHLSNTVLLTMSTRSRTSMGNALVGFHIFLTALATVVTTGHVVTVRVILIVAGAMIRQIQDWGSAVMVVSLLQ